MSLTLVDATGKRMGTVFNTIGGTGSSNVLVAFEWGQAVFTLSVSVTEIRGTAGINFATSNCSGTPYFLHFNRLLSPAAVVGPGATLYLEDPEGVPQTIVVRSRYSSMSDGTWVCDTFPDHSDTFVPAYALGDLYTVFTPPFRLR
jgi:hypothetical protein